jgi:ADP-ribose pyrophosphatase YjhB (NUDIX family)
MKPLGLNFCPNCGSPMADRFVFGRTRRACSQCGFVFFREPKLAVGALVERQGRVLLVRRAVIPKIGFWCLPAGYVEYDEGPVMAAIREVREETALHRGQLSAVGTCKAEDPRVVSAVKAKIHIEFTHVKQAWDTEAREIISHPNILIA